MTRFGLMHATGGSPIDTFAVQALARIDPGTALAICLWDLDTALQHKDSEDFNRCREILGRLAWMGNKAQPALTRLAEVAANPGVTWSSYERAGISNAAVAAAAKFNKGTLLLPKGKPSERAP